MFPQALLAQVNNHLIAKILRKNNFNFGGKFDSGLSYLITSVLTKTKAKTTKIHLALGGNNQCSRVRAKTNRNNSTAKDKLGTGTKVMKIVGGVI